MSNKIFNISDKFWKELRILFVLIVIAFTVKATLVEIYIVPTGSMENTIMTGDLLIGNKFVYGMRTPTWIGIPYTRIGFDIPWFRLPAFQKVENGDVTIFEFPRDPFQKYVKRCIGIPGDKINSNNREYYINDTLMIFPDEGKHVNPHNSANSILWPYFNGDQDNIDDFIVPYKSMKIDFYDVNDWQSIISLLVQDNNIVSFAGKSFTVIDPSEVGRMYGFIYYKLLGLFKSNKGKQELRKVEYYDRKKYIQELINDNRSNNVYNPWEISFSNADNEIILENLLINGKSAKELRYYYLKHDYYYFVGDNRDNSYDSRFWGFVPDYQVLGNPVYSFINVFSFRYLFSKKWDKFLRFKVIS